ncbi:hypothetical protein ACRASQ_19360 [Bacteroides hominis]|uniref:hypothetical protein n=1 Tax=Bacteroides TaxID=816 RepID=UPI0010FA3B34|nr:MULTISPECIES: hypothetical protein [Bacteroides]MBC5612409.1 hypothetical protein [Bacteroides hominis (ex Liu et al. 2022)]MCE8612661.1 hypothetical protein [Bacteroides fragilis]MCM0227094.1 hypothetical protein [Bacteroides fragilis]MCM0236606.1 hypothetical protein [Bacteroides fragilis]MCM0276943.1 hypothetical protein [Bacteroides fragilis]
MTKQYTSNSFTSFSPGSTTASVAARLTGTPPPPPRPESRILASISPGRNVICPLPDAPPCSTSTVQAASRKQQRDVSKDRFVFIFIWF